MNHLLEVPFHHVAPRIVQYRSYTCTVFGRTITLLMLAYYTAGVLLLPGGNFAVLHELPAMYAHCKATEDKDLTALDFITDHLTCFDALTDTHPPGDEQRSHTPPPDVRGNMPSLIDAQTSSAQVSAPSACRTVDLLERPDLYRHHHCPSVFRPPIA